VPKAGTKAHSYVELQEYWEAVVTPLFEPEDLVQHRLVNLGGEELVSRMNAVLAQNEGIRRADFRGSRVAQAQYGMLVEDMRQSLLLLLPTLRFSQLTPAYRALR
jgi:inositol-pentakisphosphate 2-kinase